jgi:hypothetical protein
VGFAVPSIFQNLKGLFRVKVVFINLIIGISFFGVLLLLFAPLEVVKLKYFDAIVTWPSLGVSMILFLYSIYHLSVNNVNNKTFWVLLLVFFSLLASSIYCLYIFNEKSKLNND